MTKEAPIPADSEEYVMINIIEDLVRTHVKEALKETDICRCQKCELDVCAITLNNLKPKYVTTKKGALLAGIPYMKREYKFDLNIEISKALKIVKEHPTH